MKHLPDSVHIRKMTPDDIQAVFELDQRSFTTPWPKKSFAFEVNENQAARLWVAEEDNGSGKHIVGMIVCWLLVDEAHVATLAVDEACRRQRIASTLLCTALTEMMQEGAISAMLEVREGNAAAQGMYRRFGFQLVGRRPGYYKDNGEDAILMTLRDLDEQHLTNIACIRS
jgi:ribosomal-protein-alanine N-acetyltransferase